jgi:predicted transcriptional regulator
VAGKVPQTLEELRAKTQYQPTNDPLGRSQTTAQKIVNRLLDCSQINAAHSIGVWIKI